MLVYQRAALQSWRKCSVNGFCLQVLNYFPRHAVLLMSAERNSQAHRSCCPLTSPLHREKANISFPFPTRPPCVCQPPLCSLSAFFKKNFTPPLRPFGREEKPLGFLSAGRTQQRGNQEPDPQSVGRGTKSRCFFAK